MRRLMLAVIVPSLILMSSAVLAATGDDLMSGIPTPPNAKVARDEVHLLRRTARPLLDLGQSRRCHLVLPGGSRRRRLDRRPTPAAAARRYGGGAGLQATNGPKYLSVNAGGPAGMTFVSVCVWPAKPNNDNCGDND